MSESIGLEAHHFPQLSECAQSICRQWPSGDRVACLSRVCFDVIVHADYGQFAPKYLLQTTSFTLIPSHIYYQLCSNPTLTLTACNNIIVIYRRYNLILTTSTFTNALSHFHFYAITNSNCNEIISIPLIQLQFLSFPHKTDTHCIDITSYLSYLNHAYIGLIVFPFFTICSLYLILV